MPKISQEIFLTERQASIIEYLASLSSTEIATQYQIAKTLSISYSSVNENMKRLMSIKAIIPISAGRGRVVKYVVNEKVVLSCCKSDFQRQKLQSSIDKTSQTLISKLERAYIEKHESKCFAKLHKLRVPQQVIDILALTDKVVDHNRMYYIIDGVNYTPRQAATYIVGDSRGKGRKIKSFPAITRRLMSWKNAITGVMQFNINFDSVDEIYPEELECIETYRELVAGTKLSFIGNRKLIELMREFTPQILLTKVMYILARIKTKIRNAYAYLLKCLQEIDNSGEIFVESHVTDSGKTITHPRLLEFYLSIKNRKTRTAKELFQSVANKIMGVNGKPKSGLDNLYKYFCNENVEMLSLSQTREGY
jgi:hypothetical protein